MTEPPSPAPALSTSRPTSPRDRLIVALDFQDAPSAFALVDLLGDRVHWYKVGMELYYASGNSLISELRARDKQVFLDLKLHDIPSTMSHALRSLAKQCVALTTVHIPAGEEALRAVAAAAASLREEERPRILGVTRLTSLPAPDPAKPWDDVVRLGRLGINCGIDGWIAPAGGAKHLRAACGDAPLLVCPGIRLPENDRADQVQVGLPEDAVRDGADWVVVGRPITQASDPRAAVAAIVSRFV